MEKLMLRNGRFFDPVAGVDTVGDMLIGNGIIEAIGPALEVDAPTMDMEGRLVVPGLCDMHAHVGRHTIAPLCLDIDACGVGGGVTLLGDAGSAGYLRFEELLQIASSAVTPVRFFFNVCPDGIAKLPEQWPDVLDLDRAERLIEKHRSVICGVKVRSLNVFAHAYGIAGLERVKAFAARLGLPLMEHIGSGIGEEVPEFWEDFVRASIELLDRGDIVTHILTGKPGALITPDRRFYPLLEAARKRGVFFDAAVAKLNFNYDTARQAMADGILPDGISTDLWFDLPTVMSRFLALGMSLSDVIRCVTKNAYEALGVACGTLHVGQPARLSVLELRRQPVRFGTDTCGVDGEEFFIPTAAVLDGKVYPSAASAFSSTEHIPGVQLVRPPLHHEPDAKGIVRLP